MGKNSKIEWCNHSFNPWWGCMKVSEGCKNCYAETQANRFGSWWGENAERRFFGDKHWNKPIQWNAQAEKEGKRYKVFCGSMCDVFENRKELRPHVKRLFQLIRKTPNLDWLLLTKRPERVDAVYRWVYRQIFGESLENLFYYDQILEAFNNVWLGTTVENQDVANKRIPELFKIPAKVRFLSVEPMLGEIDLGFNNFIGLHRNIEDCETFYDGCNCVPDWVICGGESGRNARPMHPNWARALRNQCKDANIPFFFKQWGEWIPECQVTSLMINKLRNAHYGIKIDGLQFHEIGKKNSGSLLDGKEHKEFPK